VRLDSVRQEDFDTVFYPGGHGPLWDLAESPVSIALLESFDRAGKPIGLVCHAPGVLRHVKAANGDPYVKGRTVTGFTNSEEAAVQLTDVVPFLIEDEFTAQGADYRKGPDWDAFVVTDGNLVTGQNPGSSEDAARTLMQKLA
jgi:putative intracellular protease/amidase